MSVNDSRVDSTFVSKNVHPQFYPTRPRLSIYNVESEAQVITNIMFRVTHTHSFLNSALYMEISQNHFHLLPNRRNPIMMPVYLHVQTNCHTAESKLTAQLPHGCFSKLWSPVGSLLYLFRVLKRDHNFDNHPHVAIGLGSRIPRPRKLRV